MKTLKVILSVGSNGEVEINTQLNCDLMLVRHQLDRALSVLAKRVASLYGVDVEVHLQHTARLAKML